MKILISGASGLLGSALLRVGKFLDYDCRAFDRERITIGDPASALQYFEDCEFFIHAAANTNVEYCELHPDVCYRDNLLLTDAFTAAAHKANVPVVFISSTGVYGAQKNTPYREYDETYPPTHHHKSKKLAEDLVLRTNRSNLVVRTGWLFGGAKTSQKNFIANRIAEACGTSTGYIFSNDQQRGCPTYADDACIQIFNLLKLKHSGIFNIVNIGDASRFEYVSEIIALSGLEVKVQSQPAASFNRVAPVSHNEMAVNWKAGEYNLPLMRPWREALAAYMNSSTFAN